MPESTADNGMTISPGADMTRIEVTCPHQSGLLYVVPAERSWVCTPQQTPAHALAGFFRELVNLQDARVASLMQDWGLYYRQLPLDSESADPEAPAESSADG